MGPKYATIRALGGMALVAALLLPGAAGRADDTDLFSTNVAPNVMLIADNSGSMEHIVWHPAFDPNNPAGDPAAGTIAWKCNQFSPNASGVWSRERISGNSSRT